METRETLAKLRGEQKDELILDLQTRVMELEAKVVLLLSRINKDSHNSGKPPSSDGWGKRFGSGRDKSRRKPGGQKGHGGSTLKQVDDPDKREIHSVSRRCPACGSAVNEGRIEIKRERRQVFDIPKPEVEVTEHVIEEARCGCGYCYESVFPREVSQPVQFGANVQAMVAYLVVYQCVPIARTQELLKDLLGVSISTGGIGSLCERVYDRLELTQAAIRDRLKQSDVLHVDETGWYVKAGRYWLHTAANESYTDYYWHKKRGGEGIEAGVLGAYQGIAVHDHWKSYFEYSCEHALCNAHHLRELTGIIETTNPSWAQKMKTFLSRTKKKVDQAKEQGKTALTAKQIRAIHKRYQQLIHLGEKQNIPNKERSGQRGKIKQTPAFNLLRRLSDYREEVLRFMADFTVPFDNNIAERAIRMPKVKQKISGTFRSEKGADIFCRIRGYIDTLKKQQRNIFEELVNAARNNPWRPQTSRGA